MISLILLSYKNTAGIYSTLNSILKQTYPAIEIIISDDGTPGFAQEIEQIRHYIEENKKENIKNVVINAISENGGTVKNVNSALEIAQGKYIKCLSSEDCFTSEETLQHLVTYLETTELLICFGKVRGVTPEGEYQYELLSCESDYNLLRAYTVEQTRNRLFCRDFLPAPGSIMRRTLFEQYGYFPEDIKLIEDYPYWLHLTKCGVPFGYLDEVVVDYKLSGVSSTGWYSEMFMKDMLVIYEKYIFPYDKRYGLLQIFYNLLKRQGLKFYMAKARWTKYSSTQKMAAYLKYSAFFLYTGLQNKMILLKNKKR